MKEWGFRLIMQQVPKPACSVKSDHVPRRPNKSFIEGIRNNSSFHGRSGRSGMQLIFSVSRTSRKLFHGVSKFQT
jgi:hypothetical protein